jgi:penicillin-binding protein 2
VFARRLRILLLLIVLGALLLASRAAYVQIGQADDWRRAAETQGVENLRLPPMRGRMLDRNGIVMAQNAACRDLAIDFRVIPDEPDAKWLRAEADRRTRGSPKDEKPAAMAKAQQQILIDLDQMWDFFAEVTGHSRQEIDDVRQAVVDRVEKRRERTWRLNYERAKREYDTRPEPAWYERMLGSVPQPPKPEDFRGTIAEEEQTHVIVADVPPGQFNAIGLMQNRLPTVKRDGKLQSVIELRQSQKREYPLKGIASHVLGHLSEANAEDIANDPHRDDDAKEIRPGEYVGRDGVERLAEAVLRGSRGLMSTGSRGELLSFVDPQTGGDVYLTIDSKLQEKLERAFTRVHFMNPEDKTIDTLQMNGAAVVIDVKSSELLALVSVPTFDPNEYRLRLREWEDDDLNAPLRQRALLSALEPGSTVKPIIGIGAIMGRQIGLHDKLDCNGYINGKVTARPRCWTMNMFGLTHESIPSSDPLVPSKLDFAEAIKRSCNVYFSTLGDRLALRGESYWFQQFGLGAKTDIGLAPESRGMLPTDYRGPADQLIAIQRYAAIGQGPVAATPIQLANYAATVARDGIRTKPKLMKTALPTTAPSTTPDRFDLKLDREALAMLRKGMIDVVNHPGGTGTNMHRPDIVLAAKTGSASAARLSRTLVDDNGKPLLDEEGQPRVQIIPYGSRSHPLAGAEWYRYDTIKPDGSVSGTHSWVIGFAPADDPKIAFCVLVEYGGSGRVASGSVVHELMNALVEGGYLKGQVLPDPTEAPLPAPTTQPSELLTDEPRS